MEKSPFLAKSTLKTVYFNGILLFKPSISAIAVRMIFQRLEILSLCIQYFIFVYMSKFPSKLLFKDANEVK